MLIEFHDNCTRMEMIIIPLVDNIVTSGLINNYL